MATRQHPPSDPLEAARSELAKLRDADDWDEPTGRTEVNVIMQQPTPPQPSQPQIEVQQESPGVLKVVFTVVQKFPAWGAVLVALAAIAAYVVLKLRGAL